MVVDEDPIPRVVVWVVIQSADHFCKCEPAFVTYGNFKKEISGTMLMVLFPSDL